jgi:hypothetical protein
VLLERKIEMKENTKIIIGVIIGIVISSTISITATTMIQADKVSYKTSNGDTTDVNSALDRLFDLNTVNEKIGSTDISSIGDGTITGAISNLNSKRTREYIHITYSPDAGCNYSGVTINTEYVYYLAMRIDIIDNVAYVSGGIAFNKTGVNIGPIISGLPLKAAHNVRFIAETYATSESSNGVMLSLQPSGYIDFIASNAALKVEYNYNFTVPLAS